MNSTSNVFVLTLAGSRTIREAAETHAELRACLEAHADVTLDCAGVTAADLTLIQIILAARRSATESGGNVEVLRPLPTVFSSILQRGGFLPDCDEVALGMAGSRDTWWSGEGEPG